MSPLEKLIMKKKEQGKSMHPLEQKAKLGNLASLRDEMSSMMKGDLEPKAKIEIESDSSEGLKEGLEQAEEVISGDSLEGSEGGPSEGDMLGAEGSVSEQKLSPEELALLEKLLMKAKRI